MGKHPIPLKPDHVSWTDDQWKAIMADGQDILVAAAAGSGKTAVLVERIIQKITSRKNPVDVDELLVVTFTNASAAEMKHRIGQALEEAVNQQPNSEHLRKQLGLLNRASISTLHSFCLEVIQKFYYLIDIDPAFRIVENTEETLLREEALDELFEEEYGKEGNDRFYQLVETFSNDRSDAELQDLVNKLYFFSQSHPNPELWLEQLADMYDVNEEDSIDELPFLGALKFEIGLQLEVAFQLLREGLELTKRPGGPAPRAENFLIDLEMVESLLAAKDSWQDLYEKFQKVTFDRLKSCRGSEYDKTLVDESKNIRDQAKKIIQKIKDDYFSRNPRYYLRDLKEMKNVVETLAYLVKAFMNRYQEKKREKGLVDFSDLEHYCLAILTESEANGERVPSEAALYYQHRFKEVLVDEYQDTNLVQEAILQLVSKRPETDGNLFMVGDVKQSIYRFRLAEPNLFLEKYQRFTTDGEGSGLKIDLSKNFRSRYEVLAGTNFLFKQIMGAKVGEIEYDEQAELVKGSSYPEEEEYPVEVVLMDQGEKQERAVSTEEDVDQALFDEEDLEQSQIEARWMARKIRKLISERKPIFDPKTQTHRPIQYRDIVILLRSMPWAPEIMEEFKKAGIPVYADLSTGYFNATEIAIMMSLLKVIDNPYQDIPLASVLRSPIVNCSEDELAKIRLHSKKGSYYDALKAFIQAVPKPSEEELHEKVSLFAKELPKWRSKARTGSLSELIWQLYRDTGFYEFVGGLPGGKQRQANLRALYDRARQYESTSFRGLFRFLRFIERMNERGDDLGTARALSEQEDVVRLMTIHASKGLEFPVVFVAGLGRKFNFTDFNKPYLMDKEYGFASSYVNVEKRISYPTIIQMAFKRKKRLELMAEEMRVLYVALTRAKEKLYLIGTLKNADKAISSWKMALSRTDWLLSEYDRANAKCYLDWIGPALVRHKDAYLLHEHETESPLDIQEIWHHPSKWLIHLYHKDEFKETVTNEGQEENGWAELVEKGKIVPFESSFQKEITKRLKWKYPFADSVRLRSKQSVSELKRLFEMPDETASTDLIRRHEKPIFERPKFMQEKKLTPAEIGTAMHAVMQHIPLSVFPTKESIIELVAQLQQKELITAEQAEAIHIEEILGFFETSVGKRLIRADRIWREVPFSMAIEAKELNEKWKDVEDSVLVQGIIDCLFEENGQLVLLDYKTDRMDRFVKGGKDVDQVLENRYRIQIALYTRAVEQILKRPLSEAYLYFFDGGRLIEINDRL
ncbi:helicase-exonuclease AddAB subunit AddA [Bacillus smithii]|uniref:helicase-exonuclease AddAB subunit AddA n=1 Tax=Bacillus smithii TaxID=1479 RepID=UPI0030C96D37